MLKVQFLSIIILIKEFDFYLEVQFFFTICLLENDFENWSKKIYDKVHFSSRHSRKWKLDL